MKKEQYPSARHVLPDSVCVEIGTWDGDFSYDILKYCQLKKLYCVDPYKHFENGEYPDSMNDRTQEEWDQKFAQVQNRFKPFGDKVEFMRMTSVEAATHFKDSSLDFVYIDGNHDYKAVLQDILTWYPKMKNGAMLCGDDIISTDLSEHGPDKNVTRVWKSGQGGKYGTYSALLDAQKLLGFQFILDGTQYAIQKSKSSLADALNQ